MPEQSSPTACIEISLETESGFLVASIDPTAAAVRELTLDNSPLIQSYPEGEDAPFFAGHTLLPWPNRVSGGLWSFDGQTLSLPINDHEHRAALHGLLYSRVYDVREVASSAVVLTTTLEPSEGYPFTLQVAVRYALEDSGLRVTYDVTNAGTGVAPFAAGAHPFLRAGFRDLADMELVSPVQSYLVTDSTLIPAAEIDLEAGDALNLSEGRILSDITLDTAFRVSGDAQGAVTRLSSPSGHVTELWQDAAWGWVQIFLTRQFPAPEGALWALAVEPMTSPPNALATGDDLIKLAPAQTWSASWGIRGSFASRD